MPASAPASSRGTATATCTASRRCRSRARRPSCGSGAPSGRWRSTSTDTHAEELRYLDVEWPSERLRDMVLIDTPGLASISEDVSQRTERFLASDEEGPGDADAVIYLMRHLHPMDLSFLEAFRDTIGHTGCRGELDRRAVARRRDRRRQDERAAGGRAGRGALSRRPTHRIAVPGRRPGRRADRPGGGVAARGRDGGLAEARRAAPRARPPTCCCPPTASSGPTRPPRSTRRCANGCSTGLGLFGVRLAVELLVAQRVGSAGEVADELERRSGIMELREVLGGQFASRAAVLKARSTLATVSALATLHGGPQGRMLRDMVRDIENAAHELVEIRLLSQLRSDPSVLGDDAGRRNALLGSDGPDPHVRLGLPPIGIRRRRARGGHHDDRPLAHARRGPADGQGGARRRPRRDPDVRGAGGGQPVTHGGRSHRTSASPGLASLGEEPPMIVCRKCSRRHPDGTEFCACGAYLEFDGEHVADPAGPTLPAAADDARPRGTCRARHDADDTAAAGPAEPAPWSGLPGRADVGRAAPDQRDGRRCPPARHPDPHRHDGAGVGRADGQGQATCRARTCSTPNAPARQFCRHCGQALTGSSDRSTPHRRAVRSGAVVAPLRQERQAPGPACRSDVDGAHGAAATRAAGSPARTMIFRTGAITWSLFGLLAFLGPWRGTVLGGARRVLGGERFEEVDRRTGRGPAVPLSERSCRSSSSSNRRTT